MIARARFASTPQERFVASIATLQQSIDQLPAATVEAILFELDRARVQVLGELAAVQGFDAVRLRALEQRLTDVMARFVERYQAVVTTPQQALFTLGQELAARPLVESGVTFAVPQISRRALEVAQGFQAALIKNVSAQAVADISTQLRLGVLAGESMFETMQRVQGTLTDPGPFGTLAVRAEAITRTELGRIQSIATQASLEETQRFVPDLRKQWKHSGNPRGRQGHMDADGQLRDVAETFRVRPAPGKPYEDLQYPRDPRATAASSVFCGCSSVPFRAEWADAITAAQTEQAAFLASRRAA